MRRNNRRSIRTLPLTNFAQVPALQLQNFGTADDTVSVDCST